MLIYILISILLLFLFYASYSIQGGVYIKSFCKNKKATKQLLLTFDDGPHPFYTPKVLEILNKYNIKAVFFVIGQMAEKYTELS